METSKKIFKHKIVLIHGIKKGTNISTVTSKPYPVNNTYMYIKTVLEGDTPTKYLIEAWIDGVCKWRKDDPDSWVIK
jgi:hypothetical protein